MIDFLPQMPVDPKRMIAREGVMDPAALELQASEFASLLSQSSGQIVALLQPELPGAEADMAVRDRSGNSDPRGQGELPELPIGKIPPPVGRALPEGVPERHVTTAVGELKSPQPAALDKARAQPRESARPEINRLPIGSAEQTPLPKQAQVTQVMPPIIGPSDEVPLDQPSNDRGRSIATSEVAQMRSEVSVRAEKDAPLPRLQPEPSVQPQAAQPQAAQPQTAQSQVAQPQTAAPIATMPVQLPILREGKGAEVKVARPASKRTSAPDLSHLGKTPSSEGLPAPNDPKVSPDQGDKGHVAREPMAAAQSSSQTQALSQSQTQGQTPAQVQPQTQQAPAAATQTAPANPDARIAPQIETAIENLSNAREAGRNARPELNLRHAEFGAVHVRLEASGSDLRATLNARDPGFVPAIQAALADRAIAASSETTTFNNQRGQEQSSSNSNANAHSHAHSEGHTGQRYGSSPGSAQASSQPYSEQTGSEDEEVASHQRKGRADQPSALVQSSGLYA